MEELKKLSKKQLYYKCRALMSNNHRQTGVIWRQKGLIRSYKTRMTKIRNMLDFSLKHPYGKDTSINTNKHKRDTHNQKK